MALDNMRVMPLTREEHVQKKKKTIKPLAYKYYYNKKNKNKKKKLKKF